MLAETLKLAIRSTTLLQPVPVLNSNLARLSIRSRAYPDHIISVSIHLQIYKLLGETRQQLSNETWHALMHCCATSHLSKCAELNA